MKNYKKLALKLACSEILALCLRNMKNTYLDRATYYIEYDIFICLQGEIVPETGQVQIYIGWLSAVS